MLEQRVTRVHVAVWAAFWVIYGWQALNLCTPLHISAGLLSLPSVPQCFSASVSTSPFSSPSKSPSAIRKKEHKRRESVTVGLAFTLKGTLLEVTTSSSEECALLCAPFYGSSDIFLSSLSSIPFSFSSFFFFSYSFVISYHQLTVLLFLGKKRAVVLQNYMLFVGGCFPRLRDIVEEEMTTF